MNIHVHIMIKEFEQKIQNEKLHECNVCFCFVGCIIIIVIIIFYNIELENKKHNLEIDNTDFVLAKLYVQINHERNI